MATKVALRSELFRGRAVVFLRRPASSGGDVIVMSGPDVSPAQLAAAAMALTSIREHSGDVVEKPTTLTVSVDTLGILPVDIKATTRSLQTLRSSPLVTLPELGEVRIMTIYLPDKDGRSSLKRRGIVDFSPPMSRRDSSLVQDP